ncbi:MAG TPA: hypothetical protein VLL72_10885, partial [Kiloniellales bacterium]|nr:hypothetical protein [Kiloniellales bacterium]
MTRPIVSASTLLLPILLLACLLGFATRAQENGGEIVVGYLQIADDPRYEPQVAYTGLRLRDLERPLPGAELALRESRVIGRALGLSFDLRRSEVADPADLASEIRRLRRDEGIGFFLVDADAAALRSAARALAAE